MTKPMTERQANMLEALKALPARYRVHGRAGAPLLISVLDNYDARVWRGLAERGRLTFVQTGVVVA